MASSRRPPPRPQRTVSWTTPGAGPLRVRIETASRGPLVQLHDLPRGVLFIGLVALVAGGALLPGWAGAAFLLAIALFIGWLVYLGWPSLSPSRRAIRVVLLLLVIGAAVGRVLAA